MSNKSPGNFIGHKGLGFRSVELLSDDVRIFSMRDGAAAGAERFDGFCFRFAQPDDERQWLKAQGEESSAAGVVGRVHRLQLPIPIDDHDADVVQFAADGYATLIKLPLRDELAAERATEELRLLLDERAPITLFLDRLRSLTIERIDSDGTVERKLLTRSAQSVPSTFRSERFLLEEVTLDQRRFLIGRMTVDDAAFRSSVEAAIRQRHPVEKWRDWQGTPSVSVALPLSTDAHPGTFYAFLPMDRASPFNGFLDAPFYPDADRRDLELSNALNGFLLDQVAELCICILSALADAEEARPQFAAAAIDAVAWVGESNRLIAACKRMAVDVGALRLPAMRRKNDSTRWARLDVVFDWKDGDFRIIDGAWLVKVCDLPMLPRKLGEKRTLALWDFVAKADFSLEANPENWADWAPALAADLAKKKKLARRDWEDFYADLTAMPEILPHLRGRAIFRMADGKVVAASEKYEVFISPTAEDATKQRKRLSGTALFPPDSIAKNMLFADPALKWHPAVTKVLFEAQLAVEYNLPRVLLLMGRLLGKKARKQSIIAVLGWAFLAWKEHKTPEVEKALRASNMLLPVEGGATKHAAQVHFGAGWRDTKGDLLSEFLKAMPESARSIRRIREGLLLNWEAWPLRAKGTATEWVQFMRLLGVSDGLVTLKYKAVSQSVGEWVKFRTSAVATLPIEAYVGRYWHRALRTGAGFGGFRYQSGDYTTGETFFALSGQGDHAAMPDRARAAYAQLLLSALMDMPPAVLKTTLTRTAGYSDSLTVLSPLAAFLQFGDWIPVGSGDEVEWRRPGRCWFSPRSEPLPRFVPKIDRAARDMLDNSPPARDLAVKLGLRLWSDPQNSLSRLVDLGEILDRGVVEADHDAFRKAYREAWEDWHKLNPRPPFRIPMILGVQSAGRLTPLPLTLEGDEQPRVFVTDGSDIMREQLVGALGHLLLPLTAEIASDAAEALRSPAREFRVLSEADLTIRANDEIVVPNKGLDYLVVPGREWLAEIAVLVLEINEGLSSRNTARARQALYDDFRKLRVIFAQDVTVEIDGREGPLPDILDGVLAVPSVDYPTIIVQGSEHELDWSVLARIARALPIALGRPSLAMAFRVAFLEIERRQPPQPGQLVRPSDQSVALAIGHPLVRIQEIYRSLRSTSRHLTDWLVPAAHALFGEAAAFAVHERADIALDDAEIVAALVRNGADMRDAQRLIDVCRDAESLNDVRKHLGIDFQSFNQSLSRLGSPWVPLRFENRLIKEFDKRRAERLNELEGLVRDAFTKTFDESEPLDRYNELRRLNWASFDATWPDICDELTDSMIDARLTALVETHLPGGSSPADGRLDDVRQRNRTLLSSTVESLRRLTGAWAAKDPASRVVPPGWGSPAEQVIRDVMASGAFDFRILAEDAMPKALRYARLWPQAMPLSLDLATLGLEAADLEMRASEEEKNRQEALKAKRTIMFGNTPVDGGGERSLQSVADVFQTALSSKSFLERSGKAELQTFADSRHGDPKPRRRASGDARDPEYMSQEQSTLLGFAGELAAYHYLKRTIRGFADSHWISSMGRKFLSLAPTQDDDGFDFHVPRSRGPDLYFEVKAHTGDPGYIDLERSQVAAAVSMGDERGGIWSILYVTYVRNPDLITVHELQNPFSNEGRSRYRQSGRQAMRLEMRRL
ncbi:hypothetical protein AQ779_23520 [Burkholderia pseudomallei]|nr:hypothetical protein AQ853_28925 [Burkholderia pseudomallei]OMU42836.1 hypothetical protein AQ776_16030 [Burkholderia pseudomallei]OMU74666.1 hypothetical protein AQ779_23520 [Burkholderia pseudomallei]OMV08000.1 hypothetical protein AQ786_23520 [Burkholderia pseudomallei]OMV28053.1 hypothetical protein AQ789_20650 [Burkholderia pseudomallei]